MKAFINRKYLCHHGVTCLNLQKHSSAASISVISASHVSTCKSTLQPQMSVSSRHYMYQPAKALSSRKCLCHLSVTCLNLQKHSSAANVSTITALHVSTCKSTLPPQMSLSSRRNMSQSAKVLFSRKCLYHHGTTCINLQKHSPAANVCVITA